MEIFDSFQGVKIIVVGDVMIDRYLRGSATRISPEAPVPVVALESAEDRLGGAANVALNIQALGAVPYLFSVVGDDPDGAAFTALLQKNGMTTDGIITAAGRKTTVKTRIVAGAQQLLRIDHESLEDIDDQTADELVGRVQSFLTGQPTGALIFQDYNKGVLTERTIGAILRMTDLLNVPTAVDPKKKNFLAYQKATLFKPNLKEIREASAFPIAPTASSLGQAADFLRAKMLNRYIMITLSEKGLYIDDGKEKIMAPTQTRQVADVSGAGDTVIAIAALALAAQLNIREIADLSNLAAGQVCSKTGVVPVDLASLKTAYLLKKTP